MLRAIDAADPTQRDERATGDSRDSIPDAHSQRRSPVARSIESF